MKNTFIATTVCWEFSGEQSFQASDLDIYEYRAVN